MHHACLNPHEIRADFPYQTQKLKTRISQQEKQSDLSNRTVGNKGLNDAHEVYIDTSKQLKIGNYVIASRDL